MTSDKYFIPMKKDCNSPNCQRSNEYLSIRYSWVVLPWLLTLILGIYSATASVNLSAVGKKERLYLQQLNELKQERMDSIKTNITVIITDPITKGNNVYHLN